MRHANIAVLLSGHGFGHLTRTATVLAALGRMRPVRLRVVTSAPSSLWPDALRAHTEQWIDEPCDAGVVQLDDLSVDVAATCRAIEAWDTSEDARIDRICAKLGHDHEPLHLVIGDVPPLAFELAAANAVPSIAIANFSWDWVYEELGLPVAAAIARRAYRKADLLLELTPAAPMRGFARRRRVGTVGRDSRARRRYARATLGLAPTERLVLLSFRSATLSHIRLPPMLDGWRFIAAGPVSGGRADTSTIPPHLDFADALAASDVVVAKTGYGILADCAATGRPLVWVAREGFPEDGVLEAWLATQAWARRVDRNALTAGAWAAELAAAIAGPTPAPLGDQPVRDASEAIDELLR